MRSPETRYAVRPDGVNIAYQVLGSVSAPQPTAADRATVRLARRAPGALRAFGRMIQPRGS